MAVHATVPEEVFDVVDHTKVYRAPAELVRLQVAAAEKPVAPELRMRYKRLPVGSGPVAHSRTIQGAEMKEFQLPLV